jgi:hypothetical protein
MSEIREVQRGTRAYHGGASIQRFVEEVDVVLYEAATGDIVASDTLSSPEEEFPWVAPSTKTEIRSRLELPDDLVEWLRSYVE